DVIRVFLRKAKSFIIYRTPIIELYSKLYDFKHHYKYSFKEYSLKKEKAVYSYFLRKSYHIVEKGLALPEPRLQFGMPRIIKLIETSNRYINYYGEDELVETIRDTLVEYLKFHREKRFGLESEFYDLIKSFVGEKEEVNAG